jgi:enoyl-CoA hydratase/carnithine racemase
LRRLDGIAPRAEQRKLFTGRRFDGREAQAMGLALEAVPKGQVLSRATALAMRLAQNAPLAMKALTRAVGVDRAALTKALEFEAQAESYGSADLGEGLAAAAQKRAPVFHGR